MSDNNLEKNQNGSTVFVKIGINLWLNVRDSWEIHLWYICHFKRNNIITQWHPVLVDWLYSRTVLMIWSNLKMVKYQIPNIAFLPPFHTAESATGHLITHMMCLIWKKGEPFERSIDYCTMWYFGRCLRILLWKYCYIVWRTLSMLHDFWRQLRILKVTSDMACGT